MYKELIAQYKSERKKQGFSQTYVSENAEVSMFTVNRMEKGETIPRLDKFLEMCRGIGFMVVIAPIPKSVRPQIIIKEVIVEVEKKVVDYDNFDETHEEL